jgi:hypothetical protein
VGHEQTLGSSPHPLRVEIGPEQKNTAVWRRLRFHPLETLLRVVYRGSTFVDRDKFIANHLTFVPGAITPNGAKAKICFLVLES